MNHSSCSSYRLKAKHIVLLSLRRSLHTSDEPNLFLQESGPCLLQVLEITLRDFQIYAEKVYAVGIEQKGVRVESSEIEESLDELADTVCNFHFRRGVRA